MVTAKVSSTGMRTVLRFPTLSVSGRLRIGRLVVNESGVADRTLIVAALSPLLLVSGWASAGAVQPPSYSPIRQTVSVLAGYGGTDRWIMTGTLVVVGFCYLLTAAWLGALRPAARIALVVSSLAAFGIAASPEPQHGSTSAHLAFTTLGALALALWPAFTGSRAWSGSPVLSVRGSLVATAVFVALLGWMFAETRHGAHLGLAERVSSLAQTSWPFMVALAARRGAHSPRHAAYARSFRLTQCTETR